MTNATTAAAATIRKQIARVRVSGTETRLMPSTSAPTSSTERMPPRLSTGSVASLTWLGTNRTASTSATTTSGSVTKKPAPHQYLESRNPATRGPSAEIAPPIPDHSAIDLVRPGPDHNAVINASVV